MCAQQHNHSQSAALVAHHATQCPVMNNCSCKAKHCGAPMRFQAYIVGAFLRSKHQCNRPIIWPFRLFNNHCGQQIMNTSSLEGTKLHRMPVLPQQAACNKDTQPSTLSRSFCSASVDGLPQYMSEGLSHLLRVQVYSRSQQSVNTTKPVILIFRTLLNAQQTL
jgi:hypothetical protein